MDSVIVSKMEFDNVIVWNERLNATMCIGPNKKDGTGREYKPDRVFTTVKLLELSANTLDTFKTILRDTQLILINLVKLGISQFIPNNT